MKILILRVSAIGDVIHSLPSIFLIKNIIPEAKISWVIQEKSCNILLNQDFLEKVWVLPNKFLLPKNWGTLKKTIIEIKQEKWDAIIDFQGLIKTSIIISFLSGKKFGFDFKNCREKLSYFFTNYKIKPKYTNIIQKNLALTSFVLQNLKILKHEEYKSSPFIENLKENFYLNFNAQDKEKINNWLKDKNISNFIAFSPNTTWESKLWPEENWQNLLILLDKLLNKNNFNIILIGQNFGKQAKNLATFIKNNNLNIFLAPDWDLLTTSYLISKAKLFIGPDTGLLHMADFLGIKTIGIFGPTLAKKHGAFINKENINNSIQIDCPHLYKKTHGFFKNNSIKGNCMYKLSSELLFQKIIKILNFGGK